MNLIVLNSWTQIFKDVNARNKHNNENNNILIMSDDINQSMCFWSYILHTASANTILATSRIFVEHIKPWFPQIRKNGFLKIPNYD